MCYCKTHHVNGTPGQYSWDGKTFGTYPVDPPKLPEEDHTVVMSAAGRCVKGLDSHSYHVTITEYDGGRFCVGCRNGSGDSWFDIPRGKHLVAALKTLDDESRYFAMLALWQTARNASAMGHAFEERRWAHAVLDKRVKVRKRRGTRRVEIIPAPTQ